MRDTSVVVCAATSATTTAPARISHSRRMLPSRAPLSHPRRDASLPCPRSADSTTATSAAQHSRWRRTLARRRREQRARSTLARRSCCRLRDRHAIMLKSVAGAKRWSSAHLDCSHDRYRRSRIFVGSTAGIAGIEFWPTTPPPSPPPSRTFQRDRFPYRGLDGAAGCRGLPARLGAPVSHPRSRRHLRRTLSTTGEGHRSCRGPHYAALPVAEPFR